MGNGAAKVKGPIPLDRIAKKARQIQCPFVAISRANHMPG